MYSLKLKEKCHEIAEFYESRAIIDSLQKGFTIMYLAPEEGKDLIDVTGSGKDIIESTEIDENKIHFARDENGYFAAIRGRKYYPIDMNGNHFVKDAERYKKLERSLLRRLFHAPSILFMYNFGYPLMKGLYSVLDGLFLLEVSFASLGDKLKKRKLVLKKD